MDKPQILLTNDDGIRSPGLWAAASALAGIGYVHVVAPLDQYSGGGRSMPSTSDGTIHIKQVEVNGKEWTVYAVAGSPAQAVLHGVLEVVPQRPDLIVAGINYGENVGSGVTISGTVGAALEGAAVGAPALAISLETAEEHHLSYSTDVNFSVAAHFTIYFARLLLARRLPPDVHVLKVEVPSDASPETPWRVTRLSMHRYFDAVILPERDWSKPGGIRYRRHPDRDQAPEGTDVHALVNQRLVSVTPLSLDLTSRVAMDELEQSLKRG